MPWSGKAVYLGCISFLGLIKWISFYFLWLKTDV